MGERNKKPEEVFTPRAATINDAMYVDRPDLQVALRTLLGGSKNIVIHGESGTGKSWLYKRVFAKNNVTYEVGNLGNAVRLGSIQNELKNLSDRRGDAVKTGFTEKKEFGLATPVMSGKLDHNGVYQIGAKEPFERLLEQLRAAAGTGLAALVMDNLESVFADTALMRELGMLILLLDDARYAAYGVKLVIVGVPSDVRRYYAHIENLATIANRIDELPEVARMSEEQAHSLARRGFVDELGFYFLDGEEQRIVGHIAWVTDRIPQQVHEYCLEVARAAAIHNGEIRASFLDDCDRRWIKGGLLANYTAIEQMMNSKETRAGRRNQTLYALARIDEEEFKYSIVEQAVRKEFPGSTADTELNIGQMLAELATGDNPLIRRTPKGDRYRFVSPKYRMCIRAMLRKTAKGTVDKISLDEMFA